jgi:serine/threonine protein kinase
MLKISKSLFDIGIIHNDIKPDNYIYKLLDNSNNKFELKIIDIGGSCELEKIDDYCRNCTEDFIDPVAIKYRK